MTNEGRDEILYEVRDGVARIGLNRPDALNALVLPMLETLARRIEAAPRDGARAILLYGVGRAFCAGADLKVGGSGDAGVKLRTFYHPVVKALDRSPLPVVSAVQGVAAGGGAGLALCADITVMETGATLAFVFSRIGLVPDVGSAWLLARSIGRARTLDLALLGGSLTAEEAHTAGLIARLAEPGEGLGAAEAIALKLAGMPTLALGLIRSQVAHALNETLTAALSGEAARQTRTSASSDYAEGVKAFREKRAPVFRGC